MKKFSIMASLLLGLLAFTACETDRDDNPKMQNPTTFTLLNPVIGDNVVDLEHSKSIELKAKTQPDYGYPAAVQYGVQMSLDNDWTVVEEEGATPKFYTIDGNSTSLTFDVPSSEIDKGIMLIRGYQDVSEFPEGEETVYLRMTAQLVNDETGHIVYSNVVTVTVDPYYMELKDAAPEIWWMVGAKFGNGSNWGNNADCSNMTPLYVNPANEYDKKDGTGVIEYIGWFDTDEEFKIIAPAGLGNWNFGICEGTEEGGYRYRSDGDEPSGNIKVTVGGYYKLELDTKAHTLTMTPYEGTVKKWDEMHMPGSYQGWNFEATSLMSPLTTYKECHDWDITFFATPQEDKNCEVKFAAGTDWGNDWGGTLFPNGFTDTSNNISVPAGTYRVIFNDITGYYMFIAK